MSSIDTRALKIGLGFRGIIGAVVLGSVFFIEPIFGNSESDLWARLLLLAAAIVYVVFALVWNRKYLPLTNIQLAVALVLLAATLVTGEILFVAIGLFAHAMWDLWHLATNKKYVPRWYAGACVYVDLAAVIALVIIRFR